jgi:fluoroquinolone transport system ATP-binding protein
MIDVQDLRFAYPGSKGDTLKGLSFRIERGEIFGFLGPSGAGKSTSQKLLIGLLKGYRGRASIDGWEIREAGRSLYHRIGVAFEFPNLYTKFTALENLRFFGSLYPNSPGDPLRLLEMVGLAGDADKRVSDFSKGMRMRLNLCRALLHSPEILFLDEPTAGLDPINAKRVRQIITEQRAAGKTIFLTTHNMTIADELCDRVAFLVDGAITVCAPPRDLKLRHGTRLVRVEYRSNGGIASKDTTIHDAGMKETTTHEDFPLDDIGANSEFLGLLQSGTVETIHTQEATLEDVFIKTTGRSLA